MSDTPSDYIRTNQLGRKYGAGLVILALFALSSVLNGGGAALVTLKVLSAIPFAVAWICLPHLFDPVRSRTPLTPSFLERRGLEGVLLSSALAVASWQPDSNPLALALIVAIATVVYVAAMAILYRSLVRQR